MLITDQVATAPCTDPIQVRFRVLRKALSDCAALNEVAQDPQATVR
jgi:hypothetical protein